MKSSRLGTKKRLVALALALLLALGAIPGAMAASEDWTMLAISVGWTDAEGQEFFYPAMPVAVSESGEGTFWVMLPQEAPLDNLTFRAEHSLHEYVFNPASGSVL